MLMLMLMRLEQEELPAGGAAFAGVHPPPQVGLPPVLPSPVTTAIQAKKPEAERAAFAETKMRNCHQVIQGNNPDPGAFSANGLPGALQPKCFHASRMSSAMAIPKIKLIHSMGSQRVAVRGHPQQPPPCLLLERQCLQGDSGQD